MNISFDPEHVFELEDDRKVYFTLVDDAAKEYKWHGDVPSEGDIQAFLDGTKDKILLSIRRREYPEARFKKLSDVDKYLAENPGVIPEPWISTHPIKTNIIDGEKILPKVWQSLDGIRGKDPNVDVLIVALENIFGRR